MSTYTSNIPQPGDNPSQSQDQILQNFQSISTNNSVNHVQFNDPDQGKHKFLQMPEQGSPPTTAANEAGFYSQESSLTGMTELVFRRESNGSEIEFTGFQGATNGWTRLPSGILLKWGTGTGSGISTTSFPVSANIPVFTAVYNALVTVGDSSPTPNTFATLRGFTTTGITIFGSSRTSTSSTKVTFSYLVIGL